MTTKKKTKKAAPADDPEGIEVVPLWLWTPRGCRRQADGSWAGGEYVSGPLDKKHGLTRPGQPIRVRTQEYADLLCTPKSAAELAGLTPEQIKKVKENREGKPVPSGFDVDAKVHRLAAWPEEMTLDLLAAIYRKQPENITRWG